MIAPQTPPTCFKSLPRRNTIDHECYILNQLDCGCLRIFSVFVRAFYILLGCNSNVNSVNLFLPVFLPILRRPSQYFHGFKTRSLLTYISVIWDRNALNELSIDVIMYMYLYNKITNRCMLIVLSHLYFGTFILQISISSTLTL